MSAESTCDSPNLWTDLREGSCDAVFATGRVLDYEVLALLEPTQSFDATLRDLQAIQALESEALVLHRSFAAQGCREPFTLDANPGIRVWRGNPRERRGEIVIDLEFGDDLTEDAVIVLEALRQVRRPIERTSPARVAPHKEPSGSPGFRGNLG